MEEKINLADLKTEISGMVQEALKEAGVVAGDSPRGDNKERAERRAQHELKNFARKVEDPSRFASSRITSSKRHEELKISYRESRAPVDQPVQKKKQTVEGDAGGTTIPVVVVDNGVFKTGNFFIEGTLTVVP